MPNHYYFYLTQNTHTKSMHGSSSSLANLWKVRHGNKPDQNIITSTFDNVLSFSCPSIFDAWWSTGTRCLFSLSISLAISLAPSLSSISAINVSKSSRWGSLFAPLRLSEVTRWIEDNSVSESKSDGGILLTLFV